MKFHKSLMTQFVVAAGILVLCILMLILTQQQMAHLQKTLTSWQSQADKLQLEIANLQQQAQHYKLNAPRDYESYNRDVAVFYQQFQQQLKVLDQSYADAESNVSDLENHLIYQGLRQLDSPLMQAIQKQRNSMTSWSQFEVALIEEIGNPQEPRLEWGAEYVINNHTGLNQQAIELAEQIAAGNQWFNKNLELLNQGMLGFIMLYLLVTLVLFANRIIRPVLSTTKACETVAAGEYGTKVELNGSGETRRLQLAFNELSARSKLMMDMLGDINRPGDVADKLQCIYDSGKDALGSNWIGLMAFDTESIDLHTSVPWSLDASFRHRHVSLHKALGKELSATLKSGWLNIESLRTLSLNRHDERFLRELHKNTMASQVVGYPFKCPQHNNFILVFASNNKAGFSKQQIELIKALSKLMADAIISGMNDNRADEYVSGVFPV
jgi:hypothetical protein